MKRYIAALLLPLCLAGCGGAERQAAAAGEHIEYTLEDIEDQRKIREKADLLIKKTEYDKDPEYEPDWNIDLDELKKVDVKKELSELEDITDKIFFENTGDTRLYKLTKDGQFMLEFDEAGYLGLRGETYNRVEEYEEFVGRVCKKSGLIYDGILLGKTYAGEPGTDGSDFEEQFYNGFAYTGRNSIAFVNPEAMLQSMAYHSENERVFNNLPMRVVFYMDKDKVSFVHIYWASGTEAPVMTEENLRRLNLTDEIGGTAAELAQQLFGSTRRQNGEKNGIKYKYRPDIADSFSDLKYSVLVLELE